MAYEEDFAIFGLILDVNVMLRKFFESGKASEAHKALLAGPDNLVPTTRLNSLQSDVVTRLRSKTGMPELSVTFVWIGDTKPIFFIRIRPSDSSSQRRIQCIEKLKLLTQLANLAAEESYKRPGLLGARKSLESMLDETRERIEEEDLKWS
ncbi:hypothetical protein C8J56DRAFT_1030074 [Mycena floridula]|nr:hypothetical protein C8J56DRAFT_1030074 [Mycena floridula]